MNNISILGQNIIKIRKFKNISRSQLSKLSGVGSTTLYDIEKGNSQSLGSANLAKVAKALDVSVSALLDEKDIDIKDISELTMFINETKFKLNDVCINDNEKYIMVNLLESVIDIIKNLRDK